MEVTQYGLGEIMLQITKRSSILAASALAGLGLTTTAHADVDENHTVHRGFTTTIKVPQRYGAQPYLAVGVYDESLRYGEFRWGEFATNDGGRVYTTTSGAEGKSYTTPSGISDRTYSIEPGNVLEFDFHTKEGAPMSTMFGYNIAIPHGRQVRITSTNGALVVLDHDGNKLSAKPTPSGLTATREGDSIIVNVPEKKYSLTNDTRADADNFFFVIGHGEGVSFEPVDKSKPFDLTTINYTNDARTQHIMFYKDTPPKSAHRDETDETVVAPPVETPPAEDFQNPPAETPVTPPNEGASDPTPTVKPLPHAPAKENITPTVPTTKPAVPTKPTSTVSPIRPEIKPSLPTTPVTPTTPTVGTPTRPAEPTVGTPTRPTVGTPTRPTEPTVGTPTRPTVGTPTRPTVDTPTRPAETSQWVADLRTRLAVKVAAAKRPSVPSLTPLSPPVATAPSETHTPLVPFDLRGLIRRLLGR